MARAILVLPPCLISPYTVYRGAVEKDRLAAWEVRRLLGASPQLDVLSYPCPELMLLGFPRPPAPREVYERLGMPELARKIADFLLRVISEEKPDHTVVVGIKGSPTCAAFTSSSGDPQDYPYKFLRRFRDLPKRERLVVAREISRQLSPCARPGLLFEILQGRIPGTFLDFDKENLAGSLTALREALPSQA